MKATTGKTYWRSLAELQNTPEFREFVEREFPVAASEFPEGISRRRWMQLMGASLALGGLTGCRWEPEKIAPFAVRPENRIPGEPEFFATSIEIGGMPRHLLMTSFDGRPIKVEGNPQHPSNLGATDTFSQASILGLYDPDRSGTLIQRQQRQAFVRSWDQFETFAESHFEKLAGRAGTGLALLIEPTTSCSFQFMLARFRLRFPQAQVYRYSPIDCDHELSGSKLAFGQPLRGLLDLSAAKRIVCLDADLLGWHPTSITNARGFVEGRAPTGEMNRLYVVESQFSATGAAADHRLPLRSSEIAIFLGHLEALVSAKLGMMPFAKASKMDPTTARFAMAVADDLVQHRGVSLVCVGPSQPPQVHALACLLNDRLGNTGKTIRFVSPPESIQTGTISKLASDIDAGRVETLVILGGNPIYDAPGDLDFATLLRKVPTSIRLGLYEDETSSRCSWHLPLAHPFESWGDARAWDGTASVTQPLIEPLLNGRSAIETLAILSGDQREPQTFVREAVSETVSRSLSDAEWRQLLHDGFLPNTAFAELTPKPKTSLRYSVDRPSNKLELVFNVSSNVLDGRFANNGWLQETPDLLTKLTWDNAAIVSPATASDLGIAHESVIQINRGQNAIEIPVFVLPGQARGSIGLALGYGRTAAGLVGGSIANGISPVGIDVNVLRPSDLAAFTADLEITATPKSCKFATTQDHHAIDEGGMQETERRVGELVREGTWDEFQQHPDFAQHITHHNPLESLWKEPSYEGHAWGMSIDLNKCIGCNACVVACQSENNVPIVGKDQVARGREMHWIRVDRYFQGDFDNPQVVTQPVACHHCENAPCEQVCPVAATVHSSEGLNDMIYNRCVGTRYCANNCPYKVRRFNFFDYNKGLEEPNRQLAQLVINPEVTVRSRGVMEKCTYCVQRIQTVKIDAKNDRRPIQDGEIKTACQAACPSQAIEFGDLNDPNSRVAQAHANPRAYGMLAELNVKPRTKYLARIRNPNLALATETTTPEFDNGSHHGHS